MVKRNDKTNTEEGVKGKKGRTVSDDVGGKSLSDTSTSVGVKSTVIHTSVNKFEVSKRDKPSLGHLSGSEHMIRKFNDQWEKDYVRKTTETLESQTVRRKSASEQNVKREDIDESSRVMYNLGDGPRFAYVSASARHAK